MGTVCCGPSASQDDDIFANTKQVGKVGSTIVSKAGASGLLDGDPPEDTYKGGLALFIIDPQNDFHEGGSLAVPGASADSDRIIQLIKQYTNQIERIVVTLDTHHAMHIHHPYFWTGKDGSNPTPFTIITMKALSTGEWVPRQKEMKDWASKYVSALESGGQFPMIIWPPHCLLGSTGHAVYGPLMTALNDWCVARTRSINWYFKGQNNRAEMYSALKAEVAVPDDSKTMLDRSLISLLAKHQKVICCGEALSHCVNWSVRHLLSGWPSGRQADIVLLSNCASPVGGFEDAAKTFVGDMQKAGVTVCDSSDIGKIAANLTSASGPGGPKTCMMGAAGLMDGVPQDDLVSGGAVLFIIDPQNDFHEGGSLAIAGATEDSRKIASLLTKFPNKIERVVVTLDTHHMMHISHGAFWIGSDGKMPPPFTPILAKDVASGKWKARQPEMQTWALSYCQKLEAGGSFTHIIWPNHCLIGSPGHAVHKPLMEALNTWAISRGRSINFYFKGQNNRAEMYSALASEVEVPDDPMTCLNQDLVTLLSRHNKVICCGEALSHCVNWSVRHLLGAWEKSPAEIVLLEDAATSVGGFEEQGRLFVSDMKKAGVTVCKTADVNL